MLSNCIRGKMSEILQDRNTNSLKLFSKLQQYNGFMWVKVHFKSILI